MTYINCFQLCIAVGLLLSLILTNTEDSLIYEKMVAPVTSREQEFMQAFGIDDGDGTLDYKEYVILMAVRMGSVPPHLVKEIQDHFRMLDRKQGGEIIYSDLMLPTAELTRKERIAKFVGSAKSLSSSFNKSFSRSFTRDRSDSANSAALVPTVSLSPSNSNKVLPFEGTQGNGDIVVIPPNISSPTSKIMPLSLTPERGGGERGGDDKYHDCDERDTPLSLEVLELPDEKHSSRKERVFSGGGGDDDNASICSIETFDGNMNDENETAEKKTKDRDGVPPFILRNDDDKTCTSPQSETPSAMVLGSDSDEEEKEEETFHEGCFEFKNDSELRNAAWATPPPSTQSPKQRKKKQTFRGSMSVSRGSVSNGSSDDVGAGGAPEQMTPRQKEFFDEQEKLQNAQLLIEMKGSMGAFSYFFYHQLIPHAGAIAAG
jgi:hypothetical protein